MTRKHYNGCVIDRDAEPRRLLLRYIVEIVETFDLCPWARAARERDEIAIAVIFGQPSLDAWQAVARELLAHPSTRVAMVVAPELAAAPDDLRTIRDAIAARMPDAGVADFHPDAALDLASPGRLVPFVRRSPDPLLQLVPLALLDSVRAPPPVAGLAAQAQMLGNFAAAPPADVAARIANANHARVSAEHDAIIAAFDAIAADRRASYARAGITINTCR